MDEAARAQVHAQMVRFAKGHRDAFEAVYAALWPRLLGFTSGLLKNSISTSCLSCLGLGLGPSLGSAAGILGASLPFVILGARRPGRT